MVQRYSKPSRRDEHRKLIFGASYFRSGRRERQPERRNLNARTSFGENSQLLPQTSCVNFSPSCEYPTVSKISFRITFYRSTKRALPFVSILTLPSISNYLSPLNFLVVDRLVNINLHPRVEFSTVRDSEDHSRTWRNLFIRDSQYFLLRGFLEIDRLDTSVHFRLLLYARVNDRKTVEHGSGENR